jgi:hypothetical protein
LKGLGTVLRAHSSNEKGFSGGFVIRLPNVNQIVGRKDTRVYVDAPFAYNQSAYCGKLVSTTVFFTQHSSTSITCNCFWMHE